ncbi:MAG TPA: type I glyceraldehyde-3-phosphate dehydrogenase [Patescibacteria group bacterium]|nr:type I glyceraldehyde-3-phosphate dehydrogenase [Patescibacteria group bacterium]
MRFAINGFGRIGRTSFRVWFEKHAEQSELIAVNTSGSMDVSGWAYLLRYDSNYGVWPVEIATEEHQKKDQVTDEDPLLGYLLVGGRRVAILAQRDPSKLPWQQLGIETVIESTGIFTTKEKAIAHLTAGAKRVVISAPPKGDGVGTYVLGVNEAVGAGIESNASCTTNCVAPVTAVIHGAFRVKKAMMSTIHSYTDDQNLQDNSHKDLRRARSAAINIVPTTTGAAKSVAETIPELKGLFDGISYRVPTSVGSIAETVFLVEKKTTVEEVNAVLEQASQSPRWKGLLAVEKDPIVSSDVVGRDESSIVDVALTQVVDGDLIKVVAWYDNEWGYCNRLIEQSIRTP